MGRGSRSGESGVLPILAGLVAHRGHLPDPGVRSFLSAGNIVNLLVQAAVFVLLGLAEIFALAPERDRPVGRVRRRRRWHAVIAELLAARTTGPGGPAILVGLAATAAIGALQGTLITRLHLPSFVVTLAGLLGWEGVLI